MPPTTSPTTSRRAARWSSRSCASAPAQARGSAGLSRDQPAPGKPPLPLRLLHLELLDQGPRRSRPRPRRRPAPADDLALARLHLPPAGRCADPPGSVADGGHRHRPRPLCRPAPVVLEGQLRADAADGPSARNVDHGCAGKAGAAGVEEHLLAESRLPPPPALPPDLRWPFFGIGLGVCRAAVAARRTAATALGATQPGRRSPACFRCSAACSA